MHYTKRQCEHSGKETWHEPGRYPGLYAYSRPDRRKLSWSEYDREGEVREGVEVSVGDWDAIRGWLGTLEAGTSNREVSASRLDREGAPINHEESG